MNAKKLSYEDGKIQHDLDLQNHSKAQQDEHENYKLKWEGEKYSEPYKRLQEKPNMTALL